MRLDNLILPNKSLLKTIVYFDEKPWSIKRLSLGETILNVSVSWTNSADIYWRHGQIIVSKHSIISKKLVIVFHSFSREQEKKKTTSAEKMIIIELTRTVHVNRSPYVF